MLHQVMSPAGLPKMKVPCPYLYVRRGRSSCCMNSSSTCCLAPREALQPGSRPSMLKKTMSARSLHGKQNNEASRIPVHPSLPPQPPSSQALYPHFLPMSEADPTEEPLVLGDHRSSVLTLGLTCFIFLLALCSLTSPPDCADESLSVLLEGKRMGRFKSRLILTQILHGRCCKLNGQHRRRRAVVFAFVVPVQADEAALNLLHLHKQSITPQILRYCESHPHFKELP